MQNDHPTIMVVEDETLLLQAITKKLKLSGLDVVSCASGQQAVDYLSNMDDDQLPDGVWLDYYLKDMNGLAFMQTMKENPRWTNIPVVVVSNSASPEKVSNMLALGAKKYILKAEFRLDEIIQMMRDLITEAHAGSPVPAVTQPAAPPAPPVPPVAPAPAVPPAPLGVPSSPPPASAPVVAAPPAPSSVIPSEPPAPADPA